MAAASCKRWAAHDGRPSQTGAMCDIMLLGLCYSGQG